MVQPFIKQKNSIQRCMIKLFALLILCLKEKELVVKSSLACFFFLIITKSLIFQRSFQCLHEDPQLCRNSQFKDKMHQETA